MIRTVKGRLPKIAPLKRGFSECRVLGADTETWINPKTGLCEVISLQFCGDQLEAELHYTPPGTGLATFMTIIDRWARRGITNLVFFHNLSYDLQALLLDYPAYLQRLALTNRVVIEWPGVKLEIIGGKSWFGRIVFGQHRRVKLLDSFKFTFTSLEKSAEIFRLETRKLKAPSGLGKKRFVNDDSFEAYALQDAIVEYQLGKALVEQFRALDCAPPVSAAQLSANVFRRKFLDGELIRPDQEAEQWALYSFHGGLTRAKSGYYDFLNEYDFTSAYPSAMTKLGRPVAYRRVNGFAGVNGVYQIRGKCSDTEYPILFTPDFRPLLETDYSFVTGYELQAAMDYGEFKGTVLRGVVCEFADVNPFTKFVEHFFEAKDSAKTQGKLAEAMMFKRILNSLYGKTIQTQEVTGETFFMAGGLYHPILATLITGAVRADLHRLEHDCHAVHSATDSVKTAQAVRCSSGLGGISLECSGPSCVVRGKLYAHKDTASGSWKFASHGLGVYPAAEAWLQLLTQDGITRKDRLMNVKTAYRRRINPLTWLPVETKLRAEIPELPEDFLRDMLDYLKRK